jgi:hypothetical protein
LKFSFDVHLIKIIFFRKVNAQFHTNRKKRIEISHTQKTRLILLNNLFLVINPHCKKERKLRQEHYCRFYGFRAHVSSLISRYLSADHQRPNHTLGHTSLPHDHPAYGSLSWRGIEGEKGGGGRRGGEIFRLRIFEEESYLPVKTRDVIVIVVVVLKAAQC